MTGNIDILQRKYPNYTTIKTANGVIKCDTAGDIDDDIRHVTYNPAIDTTLISVSQLVSGETPSAIVFTKKGAWIMDPTLIPTSAYTQMRRVAINTNGIYSMKQLPNGKALQAEITTVAMYGARDVQAHNPLHTWHLRLGHASVDTLKSMANANWLTIPNFKSLAASQAKQPCTGCLKAATRNHTHPQKSPAARNATRGNVPGSILHVDLMFLPIPKPKRSEPAFSNYVAVIAKCYYSGFTFIAFIPGKKEGSIKAALSAIFSRIRADGHSTPTHIFTDGEKGIHSKATRAWLNSQEIQLRITADSQQNIAESHIRHLRRKAKHMLAHRHLGLHFVYDAFRYANMVMSLIPSTRLGGRTPYQEYFGKDPARSINRLRTFGSIVYFHPSKIASKHKSTRRLIFVGFPHHDGPYHAIDPTTQGSKKLTSWHAIFDESDVEPNWIDNFQSRITDPKWTLPPINTTVGDSADTDIVATSTPTTPSANTPPPTIPVGEDTEKESHEEEDPNLDDAAETIYQEAGPPPRRSGRTIKPRQVLSPDPSKKSYDAFWSESITNVDAHQAERHPTMLQNTYPPARDIPEPQTLSQAQKSAYWDEWQKAIEAELQNLNDHNTFDVSDARPERTLGTKYVFKVKHDDSGQVTKFKARLVAQGYNQIAGLDYGETYAPVANLGTITLLFHLSVIQGLELRMLDFQGAFLHSIMPKEYPVFIKPPYGYAITQGKSIRLHKSLYGTKNAGHLWWKDVCAAFKDLNFIQSTNEQCLFYKTDMDGACYCATWVDDVIIASNRRDTSEIESKLEQLGFKVSTFEDLKWYLGIAVSKQDDKITLSQKPYIEDLLKRFNMQSANTATTPMTRDTIGEDSSEAFQDVKSYRSLVGALSHLARFTRPDIMFSVFYLARFQSAPTTQKWTALKRILRYAKGTIDTCIRITGKGDNYNLSAYSDADWATSKTDRKSTSGYIIMLNDCYLLSGSAKQKTRTAQSSCESEMYAAGLATMQIIWIRNIFTEITGKPLPPTVLHIDNQACIDNILGYKNSSKLKHCQTKLGLLRDCVDKDIKPQWVDSSSNRADIFTKPLPGPAHKKLTQLIFNNAVPPQETTKTATHD